VIEERGPDELRMTGDVMLAPADAAVYNPAFDATPLANITAVITEAGVVCPAESWMDMIRV